MRFREFIERNTVGYHNDGPGSGFNPSGGSYLSGSFTGSDRSESQQSMSHSPTLAGTDLQVPQIKKTSRIEVLDKKKNPIYIRLQDGTQLFFTWDEFKRIKGKSPERGDIMSVVFQRHPGNKSQETSQIQSIEVN